MAERRGPDSSPSPVEAEPVIVDTDQLDEVVLELDDGGRLVLDAQEIRAAVAPVRTAA